MVANFILECMFKIKLTKFISLDLKVSLTLLSLRLGSNLFY